MKNSTQSADTAIDKKHLDQLKLLLGPEHQDRLYYCIADLAKNGICNSRFGTADPLPDRQQVTQFLASWFKHAGLSTDECRGWLIDYAVNVLSALSSSSPSRIRHSTKSNIKYIDRAGVAFECGCENNPFKARCEQTCAIYRDMAEKAAERKHRRLKEEKELSKQQAELEKAKTRKNAEMKKQAAAKRLKAGITLEKRWLETFGEVCNIAAKHRQKGLTMLQTAKKLNDAGFRTSKNCLWTNQTITIALKRYQKITGAKRQESLFIDKELKKMKSQKKSTSRTKSKPKKTAPEAGAGNLTQGCLFATE